MPRVNIHYLTNGKLHVGTCCCHLALRNPNVMFLSIQLDAEWVISASDKLDFLTVFLWPITFQHRICDKAYYPWQSFICFSISNKTTDVDQITFQFTTSDVPLSLPHSHCTVFLLLTFKRNLEVRKTLRRLFACQARRKMDREELNLKNTM